MARDLEAQRCAKGDDAVEQQQTRQDDGHLPWLTERGASLVEYVLTLALIAVVSIGAISLVGDNTSEQLDCVALELDEPQIRKKVLEKVALGIPGFTKHEAKFRDSCLS